MAETVQNKFRKNIQNNPPIIHVWPVLSRSITLLDLVPDYVKLIPINPEGLNLIFCIVEGLNWDKILHHIFY